MAKSEKMFIVDGNNWFTRNYFTEMKTMTECMNRLIKLVQKHKGKIVWAFDTSKSKRRLAIYPEYKAGRKTSLSDEEYKEFVSLLVSFRELVTSMGFSVVCGNDYEADDYISVLTLGFKKRFDVYIMSTDKDFLQLVDEHVFVINGKVDEFGSEIIVKPDNFKDIVGVGKEFFLDYKCIIGDNSDNIKGIEGIGEKTALKYIDLYGHYSEIKNAINEKVESAKLDKKVKVSKTELKFIEQENNFNLAMEICDLSIPQKDKEFREIVKDELSKRKGNKDKVKEILSMNNAKTQIDMAVALCSKIN